MRKLEIIFDESLMKEMLMIFKQSGVLYYTLLENVKGQGRTGGKFGNPTAPGKNAMLITVVSEQEANTLIRGIRKFTETMPGIGIKVIISDVKELIS